MHYFITLYVGYSCFSVGLFNAETLIDQITDLKIKASSSLIPSIKSLLDTHNITLDDLDFIGVCNGPGPFTSLRIGVVTANGLAYALSKPLVAISSFDALSNQYTYSLMLYNAYGGDFYYRLKVDQIIYDGCATIDAIINTICTTPNTQTIYCIGQGALGALPILASKLKSYVFICDETLQEPALKSLGQIAYQNYNKGLLSDMVEPLYLKKGYNL